MEQTALPNGAATAPAKTVATQDTQAQGENAQTAGQEDGQSEYVTKTDLEHFKNDMAKMFRLSRKGVQAAPKADSQEGDAVQVPDTIKTRLNKLEAREERLKARTLRENIRSGGMQAGISDPERLDMLEDHVLSRYGKDLEVDEDDMARYVGVRDEGGAPLQTESVTEFVSKLAAKKAYLRSPVQVPSGGFRGGGHPVQKAEQEFDNESLGKLDQKAQAKLGKEIGQALGLL